MTQSGPLVSVVVPCHNGGWSIGRTLATISVQHYTNIEIIVVDDGSTDNSADVVMDRANNDRRIHLIRQNHRGLAGARNRGVAESRGKYIAPIDADDLWHPDYLSRQVAALERSSAPFSYAYSLKIDTHDHLLHTKPRAEVSSSNFDELLFSNLVGNGSASVIRRDLLIDIGCYDETLRARDVEGAEDWKVSLLLTARAPAVVIPEHLVAYRIHSNSMSRGDPVRQLRSGLTVLEDIRQVMPKLSPHTYRLARTRSVAWQLPGCLASCSTGTLFGFLVLAYIRNPVWFLDSAALKLPIKLALNPFIAKASGAPWRTADRVPTHIRDVMFSGMDLEIDEWAEPRQSECAA